MAEQIDSPENVPPASPGGPGRHFKRAIPDPATAEEAPAAEEQGQDIRPADADAGDVRPAGAGAPDASGALSDVQDALDALDTLPDAIPDADASGSAAERPFTTQPISTMASASISPVTGAGGAHARMAQANKRRKRPGRALLIAVCVIAIILGLVYAAGVYAFSNICYPNTTIAGVNVSLMARDVATSRISSAAVNYKLTVSYDTFEWTYDPDSTDEILDAEATFDRVVSANDPYRWPIHLYEALTQDASDQSDAAALAVETIELPSSFDSESFLASVYEAVNEYNETKSGTIDAAGAYDEETGQFTVELAQSNCKLDTEAVGNAALVALSTLTKTVELDESYLEPLANGATEEELQAACDTANALIASDVDLTLGGTVVATLDGSTLALWITFDEDLTPSLDASQVAVWAEELADELDTVGTARSYTRPDGKEVTVTGGTYGWEVDIDELVSTLQAAVAQQQVGEVEIPTTQSADAYVAAGEAEWGAYVDIDLTEQHAYYYDADGNLLWDSGIITANTNKGYLTPTGVYYIVNKQRDTTLLGAIDEETGEREYESDVSYWMPFINNSIGLHDATWQASSYFEDSSAYLSHGSHGCVNLPLEAAEELYALISVGTCVVVHK